MKYRFAAIALTILISSTLIGGLVGGNAAAGSSQPQTSQNEFLGNFSEALDVIQQNYAEDVGSDKLVYSAIKGMLRGLDPHSSFFEPKDYSKLREEQHAKYYGLGIRIRPLFRDRGRVVIVEPPQVNSPAERRGLRAGDVIIRVEGESVDDWTQDEVVNHLRGPRGTTVNITIERPGIQDPLQFKVEREEIPLITVPYAFEVKPGIGYIKIDRFSESTAKELREKINKLKTNDLSGLVLDLRDNPGGLLNQAIDVADFFVPRGQLIVSTKGRMTGSARRYTAPSLDKIRVPLVVLINRHSASASEIVAGALQDHDRALIVGETSFGKGLVQSVYTLDNGTGMALTTAKYYTPSGRLIQRDYSGSTLEYYYLSGGDVPEEKDREVRETDSKRKVYGGGGITPDVVIAARELNRFEALLTSKDVFFEYARRLTSGQVPGMTSLQLPVKKEEVSTLSPKNAGTPPEFEITNSILDDFREYLRGRQIDFTNEDIQKNIEFIKRRIKQEVYTSTFGLQEGYRVAIQGDNQVLKALEVMPEANVLMTTGKVVPAAQNQELGK
ncbi:MAG: carboxyl-terminal protease [Acidobacteria bacterium]|nr:carboxyl-terminal protease [Acidobacteriota bacterium]